ncbi:accessory gene regulator B family protein [Lachnospiraceae bacterium JLR.KK009]|jgi:Membrane protein putatively involved in post-translational modification of the autoinducing quorum-sensing peptide|nr:hypothetical protein C810_04896 [Lachnospiraceae bacterium A2]
MEGIIDNISEKIADIICNDNQEFEIIIYGVHQMITIILNLFLTVISGIIWQNFSFLAVMYFYFSILRPYAGGYHSETEGKCLVISIALINLILFAKRYVRLEIPAFIVICVASMAVIFLWAPIGNPNKTLDMMEKKYINENHILSQ